MAVAGEYHHDGFGLAVALLRFLSWDWSVGRDEG